MRMKLDNTLNKQQEQHAGTQGLRKQWLPPLGSNLDCSFLVVWPWSTWFSHLENGDHVRIIIETIGSLWRFNKLIHRKLLEQCQARRKCSINVDIDIITIITTNCSNEPSLQPCKVNNIIPTSQIRKLKLRNFNNHKSTYSVPGLFQALHNSQSIYNLITSFITS